MGIIRYIQRSKEEFNNYRIDRKKNQIMQDTEQLRIEREKVGEIAKLQAEKKRLTTDVNRLKEFNQKVDKENPNKIKRFATGLASAMNKGKEQLKKQQSQYKTNNVFGGTGKTNNAFGSIKKKKSIF